jgi:hypothetical protein
LVDRLVVQGKPWQTVPWVSSKPRLFTLFSPTSRGSPSSTVPRDSMGQISAAVNRSLGSHGKPGSLPGIPYGRRIWDRLALYLRDEPRRTKPMYGKPWAPCGKPSTPSGVPRLGGRVGSPWHPAHRGCSMAPSTYLVQAFIMYADEAHRDASLHTRVRHETN